MGRTYGKRSGNRLMRACADTVPAPDALRMVWGAADIHIHFAYPAARAAAGTFLGIHSQAVYGYFLKQGVESAERADPFAERAIEENRQHHYSKQDAAFPGKQPSHQRIPDPQG